MEKHGVRAEGNAAAATADVLAELAALIARVYPLDEVQEAFATWNAAAPEARSFCGPDTVPF